MDPALRAKVEAAIDRLIRLLDAIDAADEHREPQGDDEPDLGWTTTGHLGESPPDQREYDPADMGEPEVGVTEAEFRVMQDRWERTRGTPYPFSGSPQTG